MMDDLWVIQVQSQAIGALACQQEGHGYTVETCGLNGCYYARHAASLIQLAAWW